MFERDTGAQALAPSATAVAPRHVGGRPGFVDEHQLVGIEIESGVEPLFAAFQDVGTVLLARVAGLFHA